MDERNIDLLVHLQYLFEELQIGIFQFEKRTVLPDDLRIDQFPDAFFLIVHQSQRILITKRKYLPLRKQLFQQPLFATKRFEEFFYRMKCRHRGMMFLIN